jgi:hypothetical protein
MGGDNDPEGYPSGYLDSITMARPGTRVYASVLPDCKR